MFRLTGMEGEREDVIVREARGRHKSWRSCWLENKDFGFYSGRDGTLLEVSEQQIDMFWLIYEQGHIVLIIDYKRDTWK